MYLRTNQEGNYGFKNFFCEVLFMPEQTMYDRIISKLAERDDSPGHMCNVLGIRRALISDLKSGKNMNLSAKNVAIIADYLRVTCDYLILGKEPYASLPLDEIALLDAWRSASDKEKENVAFILRDHGFAFSSTQEKTGNKKRLA